MKRLEETRQVRLFAESIAARMRGEEPPAGGYAGDYVTELAEELSRSGTRPDDIEALGRIGTEAMRALHRWQTGGAPRAGDHRPRVRPGRP